jgi:hypothetical protein
MGIDTAYKDDVPKWSIDNPAAGQCAVTALIIHDYFGGQIYSGVSQDGVWFIIGIKFMALKLI